LSYPYLPQFILNYIIFIVKIYIYYYNINMKDNIMQDKKTELIEEELANSKDYAKFMNENENVISEIHPGLYLSNLITISGAKKSQVVAKLDINTGYAYEILRQEKLPDRDKMLQFAFALNMNIDESQKMLKKCGYANLYVKNPRDAIVYYCITRRQSLIDANIMLSKQGHGLL